MPKRKKKLRSALENVKKAREAKMSERQHVTTIISPVASPRPSSSSSALLPVDPSSRPSTSGMEIRGETQTTSDELPVPLTSPHKKRMMMTKKHILEDFSEKASSPRFISTEIQVGRLLEGFKCLDKKCSGSVSVNMSRNRWDVTMSVICNSCGKTFNRSPPSCLPGHSITETNVREVYLTLITGTGRAGIMKRAAVIGGQTFTAGSYRHHCDIIYNEMNKYFVKTNAAAHKAVFDYYTDHHDNQPDADGILNIEVSFDGTWMTRGHKSHVGVGFVIEVHTGIVIDFEVLCNYCRTCSISSKTRKHKCMKNYEGKSGAMEAEEAVRLWKRSEDLKFRYVTFVGDGDSNAYLALQKLNSGKGPYPHSPVIKHECVNHIHKRMGTRLRKVKKDASTYTTTRTGKHQRRSLLAGKLTDDAIDKLQSYYGIALRNKHESVQEKAKAAWASFFHHAATDKDPCHNHCPKGETSWCKYNQAVAKEEVPPSHTRMGLLFSKMTYEEKDIVKQVYRELASPNLLQKCMGGQTQNPNESLHSSVWNKCPKAKFAGLARVVFISQVTVLEHNFGHKRGNLMTSLFGSCEESEESLQQLESRKIVSSSKKKTGEN